MKHLALLCLLVAAPVVAEEAKRPNFLFILVDDQSPFDLKVYDPTSPLETPHIDRLAAEGMTFEGAYHMGSFSGAVCMPSRHMYIAVSPSGSLHQYSTINTCSCHDSDAGA